MKGKTTKRAARLKRHRRNRKKIYGVSDRPRLGVFRSNKHIYAQIINDETGKVLISASTMARDLKEKCRQSSKMEAAKIVGEAIAQGAVENNITIVVFDRGGYQYHGRVRALAEAAREKGLSF